MACSLIPFPCPLACSCCCQYWMSLLIFVILYLGSFLIYMAVVGVAPTARNRSVGER